MPVHWTSALKARIAPSQVVPYACPQAIVVSAAVMAGLGVAALAPRMVPFGAVDVGRRLGLPELPRLPVLLHTRVKEGRPREALDALSAAFRSAVRG